MIRNTLLFGALFLVQAGSAQTTTSSAITSNNTAACPSSGTLPIQCKEAFPGQTDTRSGVATQLYDRPAGNVSDDDIHSYIPNGSSTRIFANFLLAYCTTDDGTGHCNNNVITGYNSNDQNTAGAQAEDLIQRHIDGAVMTWEGPDTTADQATLKFQSYVNTSHCTGPQACTPMYLAMIDGPSWQYNVMNTGVPGTSGASCSGLVDTPFENCIIQHLRNDFCYLNGKHFGNNAYQKSVGRPIVQVFQDEAVISATGPAPSWADVWVQLSGWVSNLSGNCSVAPYNADNGTPLVLFETANGFTHQDTSGAYYWVEPNDAISNQFVSNVTKASDTSNPGATLEYFYDQAASYPQDQIWGGAYKGFNNFTASTAFGTAKRLIDQQCGTVWVDSLTESAAAYPSSPLPFLEIATWNDYNEGTEIESGIDNCYTVGASVDSSGLLSWSLNPTNATYAKLSTVAHVEVYDSTDGTNLTLLTSLPPASSDSYSVAGLPSGNHTLYVLMVGKNSILNRIATVSYTN